MLEGIRQHFTELIALYESSKAECASLREQLAGSRAREEELGREISELRRQIDSLKLTGAFTGGTQGAAEAKEKVAKLIREIDRCIDLLES